MALVVLVQAASFAKQLDASVPEHLRKYHRCVAADADGWRPAPQVTDEPSFCNSIATVGSKGRGAATVNKLPAMVFDEEPPHWSALQFTMCCGAHAELCMP